MLCSSESSEEILYLFFVCVVSIGRHFLHVWDLDSAKIENNEWEMGRGKGNLSATV